MPEDASVIHQFEVAGVDWGELTFRDLCWHGCECKSPDDASAWFQENFQGADSDTLIGINGLLQPSQTSASAIQSGRATFGAGNVASAPPIVAQNANHVSGWQNQCGNNCTSAKECIVPVGENNTCTCQAYSSQYQPGAGTVAFVAACLVTLGGSGGKREEKMPCPCNSTYVSHGCCDVLDGLVWETSKSNLGSLLSANHGLT